MILCYNIVDTSSFILFRIYGGYHREIPGAVNFGIDTP